MADITMSEDETLELDVIIEESSRIGDNINIDRSDYDLNGLQTHTGVFNPQGTGQYTITVNGQELTVEVIGTNAVPDSGDLRAHYDAADKTDVSTTWTAEVGPDLSAVGGPTVVTDARNGNNIVRYDGTDDGHNAAFSSSEAQPNHIFIAFRLATDDSPFILSTNSDTARQDFRTSIGSWAINGGITDLKGGPSSIGWHIGSFFYNSGSSTIRIDGTQVASGSIGSDSYGSIAVAYLGWNNSGYADLDVGEILHYPQDKTAIESDVEGYLGDKWSVTV